MSIGLAFIIVIEHQDAAKIHCGDWLVPMDCTDTGVYTSRKFHILGLVGYSSQGCIDNL